MYEIAMYDPVKVLAAMDVNRVPISIVFGFGMLFSNLWYIVTLRDARRDRVISMPLFVSATWLVHDGSYILNFQHWFAMGHWFPTFFWFSLLPIFIIEIIWVWQNIDYGRKEFYPWINGRNYTLGVMGVIACAAAGWALLKWFINDPLYLISMYLTVSYYPAMSLAMIVRRRTSQGQSKLLWVCFILNFVPWTIVSYLWWGGGVFRSLPHVIYGMVVIASAIVVLTVLSRLPASASTGDGVKHHE